MTAAAYRHPLRVADLSGRTARVVALTPSPEDTAQLKAALGLDGLRKVSLRGTLAPLGKADWRFEGVIGATVVQPCVVTLDPVTTRIDEPVERSWIAGYTEPEAAGETEMPEDDTQEPLGETIDLGTVLTEALALALPAYPRADGADLGEAVFTEPGKEPLHDADLKPLAGLAALKARMASENDGGTEE